MSWQFIVASEPHLIPYLLLLSAYLLISLQAELLDRRVFALSALAVLVTFAGLRGAMTPDMVRYAEMYQNASLLTLRSVEPGFIFLCTILNALGLDYHALFFSYTLITLVCVYLGIRNYTPHVRLSLLLYVLLPGYFLNLFVEMRQICAVAIVFLAMSLLRRPDLKFRRLFFISLVVLSVCFHYSAIICWVITLMLYQFIRKRHSALLYTCLLLGGLLVPTSLLVKLIELVAMPIMPGKYHGYIVMFLTAQASLAESGQLLKTLIYIAMALCLVYTRPAAGSEGDDPIPLNLFILGVTMLDLTRSFAVLSRVSYYLIIYQIVLFPAMISEVRGKIKKYLSAYAVVSFYLAQFAYGLLAFVPEAGGYPFLHYQNVLFSVWR